MSPHRRQFLRALTAAGAGSLLSTGSVLSAGLSGVAAPRPSVQPAEPRVGLVRGNDRRANMMKALEIIEPEVRKAVGGRQVVIKPNFTRIKKEDWLASTPADSVWALCDLFASMNAGKIIIAEGTGPGTPLSEALTNYDYLALKSRFNVEFVDLQDDEHHASFILDHAFRPVKVSVSNLMTRDDVFLVSAAVLKTHSLSVVTLGLKNLVMATPMNFGAAGNDRSKMHRDPVSKDPRPFNWNLFQLSRIVTPDLVTIDGFVGMEGEGPLNGDPVESKLAIAGLDWLATDRVGIEVMGADFRKIGHYCYCAEAGMGEADLGKIQVVGNTIGECRKAFHPPADLNEISISA